MTSYFPRPTHARHVEGGLKARSKRGAIAQTWWSGRFIEVLESLGVGGRLQRGRSYARKGQVIDLRVAVGAVTAHVQGSRAKPYRVRIGINAFGKREWAQVEQALAENAWYTAKLLAGEMPDDIEEVFGAVGLSLFPDSARGLSMDCSCPDWEVPCKHLAAVCYLLAESFDEDPFAILGWRGRGRADLLENVRALRTSGAPAEGDAEPAGAGVPLADCLRTYFAAPAEIAPRDPPDTRSDSLLDQVPPIELAVGGRNVADLLRPAYLALDDTV